jgi:hypothetical protein
MVIQDVSQKARAREKCAHITMPPSMQMVWPVM